MPMPMHLQSVIFVEKIPKGLPVDYELEALCQTRPGTTEDELVASILRQMQPPISPMFCDEIKFLPESTTGSSMLVFADAAQAHMV